jgi:hypothetical protein
MIVRPRGNVQRPARLLFLILLLASAPAAEAARPWNVGYRTIYLQDDLTGESFSLAPWYPTSAVALPCSTEILR